MTCRLDDEVSSADGLGVHAPGEGQKKGKRKQQAAHGMVAEPSATAGDARTVVG